MKNWYIVQSHSSFENKVASLIKEEADKAKIADKFEEIIVPTHDVTEVKRGKRIQRKKKYFPGYVLIKSEIINELPNTYQSPTMAPFCKDEEKYQVVDELVKKVKEIKENKIKIEQKRKKKSSRRFLEIGRAHV